MKTNHGNVKLCDVPNHCFATLRALIEGMHDRTGETVGNIYYA